MFAFDRVFENFVGEKLMWLSELWEWRHRHEHKRSKVLEWYYVRRQSKHCNREYCIVNAIEAIIVHLYFIFLHIQQKFQSECDTV